ncbi:MAG TPA: bacillithiol biosynthesis cysteine-adding enzyme BshC [Terriglobia bacterium]|nr:bacillithiol biosynthesis cysteine-adding enzyme BshC [Terriglobia bacterium]
METHCIPQVRLPKTSAFYRDYIDHFERAASFYGAGSPFDPGSFAAVAAALNYPGDLRAQVLPILARQNEFYGAGAETLRNLRLLGESGTVAVVTGQQVGLFSGPAFTLYKALSAVKLSERLRDQGLAAVPIFWLATEDHDLEEVASTAVLDDDYRLVPLSDAGVRPAPHSSVGYVRLSEQVTAALDLLDASLPRSESRDRLLRDLRQAYVPGAGWGDAFARFLARVFDRWGVILLDALDPELHQLAVPLYLQAISGARELNVRLRERSEALVGARYHAQVHVDEESSLLFVAREGNRTALRIERKGGEFVLDRNGRMTAGEARRLAEERPLDISPNALFRPIIQDRLLPTVASVVGPAELTYHAQSAVLYPVFERPQPVVVPRTSFTLLDPRSERILKSYRLRVEDVWQHEDQLRRLIASAGFADGWERRLEESEREVMRVLDGVRDDVSSIDPTLLDASERARRRAAYQFERLKGKITRAAFARSEVLRRHEQALRAYLLPHGELQERSVGGVYFLGRAGYELLEELLPLISTDSACHHTFRLQYATA